MILAISLLISFAVMSDFNENMTDSFVAASARQAAEHGAVLFSMNNASCIGNHLKSMSFSGGVVSFSFQKCAVEARFIADFVESKQCGAVPNGDSVISCGPKNYEVVVV